MQINPVVFFVSAGVTVLFVILGAAFTGPMGELFGAVQNAIVTRFGWFYILSVAFFLGFVLWLFLSSYGRIRLGADDDEPEYSYATWFAMLFSAGMGIGLVFYGVAEPLLHFAAPLDSAPGTAAAANEAMRLAFFHWGLHAWGIYIVVGLSLAYFAYRHQLPLTIRSTFYPLLGDRIHGPIGHVIEIMAVFGTLFGIATSLGLGVMQINAGLEYLRLLPVSTPNQLWLIAGITLVATGSVFSGLDRGIRRLSELNLGLALLLLLFVFTLGPTAFLLSLLIQAIGSYVQHLVEITFRTTAFRGIEWQKSWTMFYWGWWISWAPFVGMFIARISKGRTIREFIGGVLFVPALLTFLWFTVFGGTAIHFELFQDHALANAVRESVPTALFVLMEKFPWSAFSSAIATLIVATFFVTSADSGALVIDTLTSGGESGSPVWQRIFWALTAGAVAAILLLTGGLSALQTAAITTALPFSVIMLVMCYSLLQGLRGEKRFASRAEDRRGQDVSLMQHESVPAEGPTETSEAAAPWRSRLKAIIEARARPYRTSELAVKEARRLNDFIDTVVLPAFRDLRVELERHGREAAIERRQYQASLLVRFQGQEEFSYSVRARAFHKMTFAFPEIARGDEPLIYRAEVVLRSGARQEHEVERFTRQAIIEDFLNEYSKWARW